MNDTKHKKFAKLGGVLPDRRGKNIGGQIMGEKSHNSDAL